MNLISALDQLRHARQYVRDGKRSMAEQRKFVAQLERRGRDPLDAILLLEQLEEMQEKYQTHCDRLGQQIMGLLKLDKD